MPQQINLYNPALEAKRTPLSMKGAAAGWLATVALVVAIAAYQLISLRSAEQQARELEQQVATAQADALRLGSQMASRRRDPRIAEEATQLEGEVRGRQEVMNLLAVQRQDLAHVRGWRKRHSPASAGMHTNL